MLFSLQAIKTVDFTNAPVTSFHFNKLLSLSLFFCFRKIFLAPKRHFIKRDAYLKCMGHYL